MGLTQILQNRKKVLGMNMRNLYYIRKYNKDRSKEIADDKILTKSLLNKANIPTPALIKVINNIDELLNFDWDSLPKSYVIKPVSGLEGGGIDIFYNRDRAGNWIRADKSKASLNDMIHLGIDILNGRYSLHHEPDRILFEERIKNHKAFKYYTYKGSPDIRVIVFNGIPIMGMIRLPTKESAGKANLALGAVGAGIDIARGITTTGIYGKSGIVEFIPGTKLRTSGLKIPYWDKLLRYSIQAQKATNLNFAAVDFLMDRENGPVIVELNARAGLSIQLANADGLRWRLRKAIGLKVTSVEKGIRLGKDLFGGVIEEEVENITGKDVIGIYESISLYDKKREKIHVRAKIDTGADSTSMDKTLAKKLGYGEIVELINALPKSVETREKAHELIIEYKQRFLGEFQDLVEFKIVKSSHGISIRPYVSLKFKIQDTNLETKASIVDRSKLKYPVIIGRKSLTQFLVDPTKKK